MNNKNTIQKFDVTKKEDWWKFNPNQSFVNLYETELIGQEFVHQGHPACEFDELYCQQNVVVVHLS